MSQEELSGSISQLEVSLSIHYNSRVIFAAERRCYCELWQTHWVLQQHWKTKCNEFRKDAHRILSQSLPAFSFVPPIRCCFQAWNTGLDCVHMHTQTHAHFFYVCRVVQKDMAIVRYFILAENTEYWIDLKWKRGQEASVTFSWIHQRISMSTWNPQHFVANQLTNEKTRTCPKQWLHLKFLSFETAAPIKGESVVVSWNATSSSALPQSL